MYYPFFFSIVKEEFLIKILNHAKLTSQFEFNLEIAFNISLQIVGADSDKELSEEFREELVRIVVSVRCGVRTRV